MHDIILAFEPELAGIAGAGLAVKRDIVVIGDGFGADEAFLKIAMDHARRLRCPGPFGDGPGTRLLRPGGKEGDEMEKRVAGTDHPVEAGLRQADGSEIFLLLRRRQNGNLTLDLRRYDHGLCVLFLRPFEHSAGIAIAGLSRALIDIADIEDGF